MIRLMRPARSDPGCFCFSIPAGKDVKWLIFRFFGVSTPGMWYFAAERLLFAVRATKERLDRFECRCGPLTVKPQLMHLVLDLHLAWLSLKEDALYVGITGDNERNEFCWYDRTARIIADVMDDSFTRESSERSMLTLMPDEYEALLKDFDRFFDSEEFQQLRPEEPAQDTTSLFLRELLTVMPCDVA